MSENAFLSLKASESDEDIVDAVYDSYAKKGVISKAELAKVLTDYASWKGEGLSKRTSKSSSKDEEKKSDGTPPMERQTSTFIQAEYAYDVDDTEKEEKEMEVFAQQFKKRHAKMKNFVDCVEEEFTSRLPQLEVPTGPDEENSEKDKEMKVVKAVSKEEAYTWDLVFVFRIGDKDKMVKIQTELPSEEEGKKGKVVKEEISDYEFTNRETARVIRSLERANLKTYCYLSVQDDEIYCLVGANEARLSTEGARVELELELDPDGALALAREAGMSIALKTGNPKFPNLTKEEIWTKLFGTFKDFEKNPETAGRSQMYMRHDDSGPYHANSPFQATNRLKLTASIIEAEPLLGGADLRPRKLMKNKKHPLLAYFALHNRAEQARFRRSLLRPFKPIFFLPSEEIKDYYGEQVAIYFNFLGHYTRWLIPAGILGFCFSVYQVVVGGHPGAIVPGLEGFALAMAIWATAFLESWKRNTAVLRQEFGMTNFDTKETDRPEFKGDWAVSRITGKIEEQFPLWNAIARLIAGQSFTVTFLILLVGILFVMIEIREFLVNNNDMDVALILAALINAVVIQVCNQLYHPISRWLNEFENHRTDSQYENLMIFKSASFKLFNSYSSLIYIAFIKRSDDALGYCKQSYVQLTRKLIEKNGLTLTNTLISALEGTEPKTPNQLWDPSWGNFESANTDRESSAFKNCMSGMLEIAAGRPNLLAEMEKEVQGTTGNDLTCQVLSVDPTFKGDCMMELSIQLGIIFATMIVVNNFLELAVPWATNKIKAWKESKPPKASTKDRIMASQDEEEDEETGKGKEEKKKEEEPEVSEKKATPPKSPAEMEFELSPYEGTFADYDELIVQFGFVILFVVAFPATPFLAMCNNFLEIWIDGTKLDKSCRRPMPKGAKDIGTWYSVLEFLSWIAIITNVGVIVFEIMTTKKADAEEDFPLGEKLMIFLIMEHCLFAFKALLAFFIPDESETVVERKERSEFITDVIIGR